MNLLLTRIYVTIHMILSFFLSSELLSTPIKAAATDRKVLPNCGRLSLDRRMTNGEIQGCVRRTGGAAARRAVHSRVIFLVFFFFFFHGAHAPRVLMKMALDETSPITARAHELRYRTSLTPAACERTYRMAARTRFRRWRCTFLRVRPSPDRTRRNSRPENDRFMISRISKISLIIMYHRKS